MKHLDLFSGIGGFAYAAQKVFGQEHDLVGFCDNDKFCQKIISLRFPNVPIYEDIKKLSGKRIKADIITGGFPCQPFSQAGKRRGTEDDRHLWPEMLRVIREVKPKWVVGENVLGLVSWNEGMVLEQVVSELEAENYEVQPYIIPACGTNAPHQRYRVWIIANRKVSYDREYKRESQAGQKQQSRNSDVESNVANSKSERNRGSSSQECRIQERKLEQEKCQGGKVRGQSQGRAGQSDVADTDTRGNRRHERPSIKEETASRRIWESNWLEIATELCRVDDGLPGKLDGYELSKAGHRIQRLKTLGNAIVPQVAMQIFKTIKQYEICQKQ